MKKLIIFVAIVLLILVTLVFAKNAIAKIILEKAVRQIVGLGVDVKHLNVGLQKTFIEVKGLNIFNPPGFGEKLMADLPEVYVDFDLGSLLRKNVHLESLRLHLKEFIVIRAPDGRLNINSISGISEPQKRKTQETASLTKAQKEKMQIDLLELKVGRVLYKDYTFDPVKEFYYNVNIDEAYENVTDVEKLVKLIVTRSLVNTAVSRLSELNFDKLRADLSGLSKKGDILGAIQDIGKQLGSLFGEKESQ